MKFGVVVFPGSNCDHDCFHVVSKILGHEACYLWHKETDLKSVDCIILPGGFSYGDYLRSGAMAACSPIMETVKEFAGDGGLVIGICNGFQILVESGLLPGSLVRNRNLKFICRDVYMRIERTDTPFTCAFRPGEIIKIPIAHMDGHYYLDKKGTSQLVASEQILFRYCDPDGRIGDAWNPNGSVEHVAGIINKKGNVCGLMPHPERCSESLLGNRDGLKIFESMITTLGREL